ncbi:hypothetical protein DQ384_24860 [Sphaerisporangium album]|uniref:Uncharacterized protein n=1 Tax=Sphaerisporangium album TaxID=509200 RepID=A0A367FDA4_9ACTN|nr:hypothetical protein [Sphaerisporangium album]RCG28348.1 hypothetical protein DQ384_24860 [Sphaerisporangium album]
MDVAQLAAFLAPFLGSLLGKAGTTAAEVAGEFGEAAWEQATKLWRRLAGHVAERPAAQEAAEDVAEHPDSEGARGALAWQLEKLLASDTALRDDLARLWREGAAAGVTVTTVTAFGHRSVAVGGDVKGTITTGDAPRPPVPDV